MSAILTTNTKQHRERVFTALYRKAFPAVARYVAKMGGSFDEAKDVFQDALIIYYEKQLTTGIALKGSENAYLLGIAKHLWIKAYHVNAANVPLEDSLADEKVAEKADVYAYGKLMHYLETAGQKCMEVLRSFYFDKLTVSQVAQVFGYSGTRSATVQKYKCLEKVRDTIKEKALHYEDFVE